MSAFENLNKYWSSADSNLVKLIAATPWASMREQDPDKLDHLYEKDDEQLEKGKRGDKYWDDPYAMATAIAQKQGYTVGDRKETGDAPPWGQGDFAHGNEGAQVRDKIARAIIANKGKKKKKKSVNKMMTKAQETRDLEKISPGLERLIAFGAGWALSGDVVNRDVPPELVREWERAINRQASDEEKRRLERKIRSRLRKSDNDAFDSLHTHFLKQEGENDNIWAHGGDTDDIPYEEDEVDPQWEAWAQEGGKHDTAALEGWGGKEHDMEDFHPESGQLTVPGQGAHNIKDWAKGIQEQTGVPLVGGPTGNEPHDDIYQHHGIEGGHMSGTPITPQHIADYVQNKTGQSISVPGTENPSVQQMVKQLFMKDHAPVPPRIGLMWDAVKHRWTRPERIGRTVWELSGHKRIRGTGTGSHERSTKTGGIGGRGAGSASAGRRFKSTADSGKLNVHDGGKKIGSKGEQKHPALRGLAAFRKNPARTKK